MKPPRTPSRSLRQRRSIQRCLLLLIPCLSLFLLGRFMFKPPRMERDVILSTAPLSTISKRIILFTTGVNDGDWPTLLDTRQKLLFSDNKTQIYSSIPRNIGPKSTILDSDIVFATSGPSHIIHDGFKGIALLPRDDRGPAPSSPDRIIMPFGSIDNDMRMVELLPVLSEHQSGKWFIIVDAGIEVISPSRLKKVVEGYNPVESHIILDQRFPSIIILSKTLIDRIFERGTYDACSVVSGSGMEKIIGCVAMTQGRKEVKAIHADLGYPSKDDMSGFFESGRQPISLMNYNTPIDKTLLKEVIAKYKEEVFSRTAFYRDDKVHALLHHGFSYVEIKGSPDLDLVEQTWSGTLESGYRARDASKKSYFLSQVKTYEKAVDSQYGERPLSWSAWLYRDESGDAVQVDWVS